MRDHPDSSDQCSPLLSLKSLDNKHTNLRLDYPARCTASFRLGEKRKNGVGKSPNRGVTGSVATVLLVIVIVPWVWLALKELMRNRAGRYICISFWEEQGRAQRTQGGFMWNRQFFVLQTNFWASHLYICHRFSSKEHLTALIHVTLWLPGGHLRYRQ